MVVRPARSNGLPLASTIWRSSLSTRSEPLLLTVILVGIGFHREHGGLALFSFFGCFDGIEILGLARLFEGIGEGLAIVIGCSLLDPVIKVDGIVECSEYRKVMMTFRTENIVAFDSCHDSYLLQNDLQQSIESPQRATAAFADKAGSIYHFRATPKPFF